MSDILFRSLKSPESRARILFAILDECNCFFPTEAEKIKEIDKAKEKLRNYYQKKIIPIFSKCCGGRSSRELGVQAGEVVKEILFLDFQIIDLYFNTELKLEDLCVAIKERSELG